MLTRDIDVTLTFTVRGPDDASINDFVMRQEWLNPDTVGGFPVEVLPGTVFVDHMEDADDHTRELEF